MSPIRYQCTVVAIVASLMLSVGTSVNATDLKTIMADPDWIGAPVESAWWQLDGSGYWYRAKRKGSTLRDTFAIGAAGDPLPVSASLLARGDGPTLKYHALKGLAVSINNGALVLRDLNKQTYRVLFAGTDPASRPQFSPEGDAVFFFGGPGLVAN